MLPTNQLRGSLLPLLALVLLVTQAQAQRPVRILYFDAPTGAPSSAHLYAGSRLVSETELPRHNFTETIEVPGGNLTLSFLPGVLEEGDDVPASAPKVSVPEGWDKALLLVFEDEKNPVLPIRIKAIDASDDVFGPGSVYFVNFSGIRVGGNVGDKRLDLKPMSFEIIKNPVRENGYYPTRLFSINQEGERPRRFVKQMWEHNGSDRQLLFIIPKPAPVFASYYCAPIRDF
ncbi:MAG: hypothetical protein Q7Q71_15320 [Verrucomicrobiota bacterium JB023]|nr:hypothetical protein [Verrucomicrobiota bacterium JB023]